ncbi:MAG: cellulase family glycosylhydrolase [Acidimicrobiales bacterium]|jgi:endoglycosylceramidase
MGEALGEAPTGVGGECATRGPGRLPRALWCGAAVVLLALVLGSYGSLASASSSLPVADPASGPVGPLRSLGGPELTDQDGRTVLLHGVDLVYKIPPYEVEVQGTGRNVLTPHEAQRMAQLGFNVVRLGIIWKGLEPGTDPINDPSICAPGSPGASGPGQFDAARFDAYMGRLEATVSLLARYGISSLIDMHQDVYNEVFGGEGAPDWAVCTDGITPEAERHVQNWSINYTGPGVAQAYDHFWDNDVVGNLQGAFDSIWTKVAARFRGNPWIVGYDPFNEPYGSGLNTLPANPAFDAELECLYTGRDHPGLDQSGQRVTCPADDPEEGLIPRIEAADPTHLVAYEGNYGTDSGVPNYIGAMDYPRLVLNFHDYCFLHVPNGPEPPDFASTCGPLESHVFTQHDQERVEDTTTDQPGGPGWLLTEFGATTDTADLTRITFDANANLVGWIYWQWINYDDPTGSHSSALWPPRASTASQLNVLSETYASAVAGTPTSMVFDPETAAFTLQYRSNPAITAPTVIVVPVSTHYPHGYCLRLSGARSTSRPDASRIDIENGHTAESVSVSVTRGTC